VRQRRKTEEVAIGNVMIGGHNPIAVQTMAAVKTNDVDAVVAQAKAAYEAGCHIFRVSVFDKEDAECLGAIKKRIPMPLVADIHFRPSFAMKALEEGVDKVRLNPGNIGGLEAAKPVILEAKKRGTPIRLGVNSGSVEKDLLQKYGYPSAEAMVESAMRHVEFCESLGFRDIVISIKSTDLQTTLENYRLLSKATEYPLHVGLTEAGMPGYGHVKSALGIGMLLLEGIGDTIRVSLTKGAQPNACVEEVRAAFDILKATGVQMDGPEVIACPSCGRIDIELEPAVAAVKAELQKRGIKDPIKISILGCAVNGPGEAREADVGVAGGKEEALIFRGGKITRKVPEAQLVSALLEEVETFIKEKH
jgi:(E)-4-hydroxy-3-methylbut-2-enyl-diphosphate synthase